MFDHFSFFGLIFTWQAFFFSNFSYKRLCICLVYMPVETAKNCNQLSVVPNQRALSYLFSLFFFVLFNYLVFCVLIMLNVSCEGNFSQPSRASQAADNFLSDSEPEELSDKINKSISSNILKCDYFDLKENTQIYSSKNNSLHIIHLNIRSLNKNFDKFYDLSSLCRILYT